MKREGLVLAHSVNLQTTLAGKMCGGQSAAGYGGRNMSWLVTLYLKSGLGHEQWCSAHLVLFCSLEDPFLWDGATHIQVYTSVGTVS